MSKITTLIGKIFNDLTVISLEGYGHNQRKLWRCKCVCGNEVVVPAKYLQRQSTRDCGCKYDRFIHGKHRRKGFGESLKNRVMDSYIRNAKNKSILFNLTNEQMVQLFGGDCHFCGNPPQTCIVRPNFYGSFTYNGIDRLIPDLGYIFRNCVSCCQRCNFLKNSYTENEFLEIIRTIYLHCYGTNGKSHGTNDAKTKMEDLKKEVTVVNI